MLYSNPDGSGSRHYAVFQGIVGNSDRMNGNDAGNVNSDDQADTCDNLDDSLEPTHVHINSYWFAAVFPVALRNEWIDFFEGGGSQPSGDFGVALCDTFGCLNLIGLTIGTSSALGFLDNQTATSTIDQIGEQCSQSGNFFSYGICASFAYLFLPDPAVLNEFAGMASSSAERFPISWFYGVREAFGSASASGTITLDTTSFSLHDLGIGSGTPIGNILPDTEVFSTSTITHFMPAGLWTAIQALMAAALWISLATYIWYSSRNLFHV